MGRYPHLSPFSPPGKNDEDAVLRALTMTGTARFAERPMNTLSGGERQKVYIAAALSQESPLILLDEPTTFLDYKHQTEILGILTDINRNSRITIIMVTHDINVAALCSKRVLALKEGAVAYFGPTSGILDDAVLESIYETSFLFAHHPQTDIPIVLTLTAV
jgi:iron complex transport system ATP-binding protein